MYFDIKEDRTIDILGGSKIALYKSKTMNKGSVFYEMDTLDQKKAEEQGKSIINYFLNCMLVALDIDNLVPPKFPQEPELLNPEQFKDTPRTIYKDFTISCGIVATLEEKRLTDSGTLANRINDLDFGKQTTIRKCLFWLRKGAEATNDERFTYRWISLETLLATIQKNSTEKMLSIMLNNYLKNERAKEIFEKNKQTIVELSGANLIGWNGAKYSEKLKEILKQTDFKAIMTKVILCIFEARNRLFHRGEVTPLLVGCNSLLRDLIREVLMGILGI